MTDKELARLEELARAATPRGEEPWKQIEYADDLGDAWGTLAHHCEADWDFTIAADPETILALVAEVRRLRAERICRCGLRVDAEPDPGDPSF